MDFRLTSKITLKRTELGNFLKIFFKTKSGLVLIRIHNGQILQIKANNLVIISKL